MSKLNTFKKAFNYWEGGIIYLTILIYLQGISKVLRTLKLGLHDILENRRKIAQRMIEGAIKSKEQRKCNSKIIDNFEKKKIL